MSSGFFFLKKVIKDYLIILNVRNINSKVIKKLDNVSTLLD